MSSTPIKLYKYCSPKLAKEILATKALEWKSPAGFNDPFQPNHTLKLPFDREIMLKSAVKIATAMIFAPETPRGDSPLINAVKRWRAEERFQAQDEAEGVLTELLSRMVDQKFETLDNLINQWRTYVQKTRIANFSTGNDNLLCWEFDASQHRGLCLQFETGSKLTLDDPKEIEYSNSVVEITSLKEQIGSILYNTKEVSSSRFEKLLLTRPPQFKFQQEWRCFKETTSASGANPAEWVDNIPFSTEELSGICFGVATPENIKSDFTKLLKKHFPATHCYQAEMVKGKYGLEIVKL